MTQSLSLFSFLFGTRILWVDLGPEARQIILHNIWPWSSSLHNIWPWSSSLTSDLEGTFPVRCILDLWFLVPSFDSYRPLVMDPIYQLFWKTKTSPTFLELRWIWFSWVLGWLKYWYLLANICIFMQSILNLSEMTISQFCIDQLQ